MGENLNQPPSVAIIIVTFNDPANLSRCLTSLKKELIGQALRCHLTVVDNSTDDSAKKNIAQLVKRVKQAVYIDPKTNTGFARGNNIALKQEFDQGTDYCFLLNSDTELFKGSIAELVETQIKTNSALVGPTLVYGDRPQIYWYGGGRWQPYLGIVRHLGRNELVRPQSAQAVTFINGAALLIPKATYLKYGGFFEPYFMYYEDSDYSAQLVRAGEQLYYEPRVVIKHYVPAVT
ncbi:MAG: glycosyltransferase family 2 protein, partial [bacterium]|nr:glycosyltransferase family 2 protein [bacterium]